VVSPPPRHSEVATTAQRQPAYGVAAGDSGANSGMP
jgi:hypothetical protein